jgi:Methyltransferase domain
MSDHGLIARALQFHPWDAMAPAALEAIAKRGPFQFSAETGCGGSTIVLSHISKHHTAFAVEGADRTITGLSQFPGFRGDRVVFVEGETKRTLPLHLFEDRLDLALLDGPHAYPLPQLEFAYLFPQVRAGGWMVLDDLQIPSVYELARFLRKESSMVLEEVAVRTAFFRKLRESDLGPDGWQHQGMNRRGILRYSWRDRLRRIIRGAARQQWPSSVTRAIE